MKLFLKIILCIPIFVSMSVANIDSLETLLENKLEDETRFEILLKLSKEYQTKNSKSSFKYAKKSLDFVNDSLSLANAYRQLGHSSHRMGDYSGSLDFYQNAVLISQKLNDKELEFDLNTSLGYLLLDIKDIENAGLYFYKNLGFYKNVSFRYKTVFLTNFARFLEESNKVDSAINIRQKVISLSLDSSKFDLALHNTTAIASTSALENQPDSANKYYNLALNYAANTKSRAAKAILELNFGIYNGIQGNYKKAVELINESRDYFSKTEPEGLVEAYKNLKDVYNELDEKDSVIKYLSLYYELKDSLLIFESQARLAELEIVKDNERKYQVIKEHEESIELRERFYIAVGFLFLILLILSIFLLRNNTKEKKRSFELRKLNQTLDDTNHSLLEHEKELSALNQTKDKFFSIIAHDLKNPVSAISSSIEFINNNIEHFEKDELKDFISDAAKQSKQLANLLNNLLTWSRSQRGLVEVQKEMIDIDTLMSLILGTCKGMADKKSIELVLEKGQVSINSDKNLIDTIVRNLVSNSIKFTPEKGKITVSSEFIDGNLLIHVADTGTGIPKDKLNGLFSLETNSSEDGTSGEKGTGLGLVLCQEFAEKLGGNMSVTSELGVGSKFTLTIPEE